MKTVIKIAIAAGILVAIIGAANTKKLLYSGVDKGIDAVENGVNYIGQPGRLENIGDDIFSKIKNILK